VALSSGSVILLSASYPVSSYPAPESYDIGFRVVEVPESVTMALLALGGIGMLHRLRSLNK
jgi:hypothetical protein